MNLETDSFFHWAKFVGFCFAAMERGNWKMTNYYSIWPGLFFFMFKAEGEVDLKSYQCLRFVPYLFFSQDLEGREGVNLKNDQLFHLATFF